MPSRFYTVLILPDATSPARKLHINKTLVTIVSSIAAVAVLAFAFFLVQYVNLNLRMLELKQLRQEVGDRNLLATKVGQLEGELGRLRDLDRKLRVVAGLEAEESKVAQGGAETLSQAALLEAVKKSGGRLADWVGHDLEILGNEITSRERSFRELKNILETKRSVLASTPTIWPVKGLVTAGYGYRLSPFTGQREMHEGLDIAAPYGTPIHSTADGVVSFVGGLGSFGNVVFINHRHGFTTFYAHLSSSRVKEGQTVTRGQVIATVGTTGRTTGPHVHYEVQVNGATVNPVKYIIDPSDAKFAREGEAGGQS